MSDLIRSLVVLCLFAGFGLKGYGQVDAQLQAVNSHLAGTWVGINHDYTKGPMVSNPVRIEIREHPKKRELRMEYTYGTKGQKGYDHLIRFMTIMPTQSIVDFHWQHRSVEHYHASGLDEVLSVGYGEFTFAGKIKTDGKEILYRCIFHIESDRFTYAWDKSDDGVTFFKSGDWTLTREPTGMVTKVQP